MSQNGQTHFKNLAAYLQDFQSVSEHLGTLCIKRLNQVSMKVKVMSKRNWPFRKSNYQRRI